ncbi:MAG TPA: SurA N-terminal domain-containing protein [Candidatus Saccharimonadales bacterium]|nr:SurA N-terminal domain-containing protein [Candidatus Saccharimonadales bacterium]
MKKLPFKRRDKAQKAIPTRITNETVAEHRERILAGGRRFKYPMQYARHRLVFNTVIITIAALILIAVVGWWQLYPAQNTSNFFYRVTRVLPFPVASVDGESVRYSDYLMYYNSSAHYLQQSEQVNLQSEDGKRQIDDVKRKSMNNAITDTYAQKLARQLNISVGEDLVNKAVSDARDTVNGRISQETYDASALSVLGWSPDEYRQAAKNNLIRHNVAYAIDTAAQQKEVQAAQLLQAPDADLDKIATQLGGEGNSKATIGVSGLVPRNNQDGGLSAAALKLEKGKISPAVKTTTGDGYYFVKLLDKNDTQISYTYLCIPLTRFSEQLAALKKEAKVHEYISIPAADSQKTIQQ